jgi:hypothetical protein
VLVDETSEMVTAV